MKQMEYSDARSGEEDTVRFGYGSVTVVLYTDTIVVM